MSESLLVGGTIRTMEKADVTPQHLKNYGIRVRKERRRLGMTQQGVADRAEDAGHPLSTKRLIELENGRYPVPNPKTQSAIEAGLGLDENTASPSLYGNTPLIRDGKPVPSETGEPLVGDGKQPGRRYTDEDVQQLYTEEQVQLLIELNAALDRHGAGKPEFFKMNDKIGFDSEGIKQFIAILNAARPPEG